MRSLNHKFSEEAAFRPSAEIDSLPPLFDQEMAIETSIEKAFENLEQGVLKEDEKKSVAASIGKYFRSSESGKSLSDKILYFDAVLNLIDKAIPIIKAASVANYKRALKKQIKNSSSSESRTLTLKKNLSSRLENLQYTDLARPYLLNVLGVAGVEKFVERATIELEKSISEGMFNSSEARFIIVNFKKEIEKFHAQFAKPVVLHDAGKTPKAKTREKPEIKKESSKNIDLKLKADIDILYQSIKSETGAFETDMAVLPTRILISKEQLEAQWQAADEEKNLHVQTKKQLQEKVDFLTMEYPELSSDSLIVKTQEALWQLTRILKPALSFKHGERSAFYLTELARLKKTGGDADWFTDCDEAVRILSIKEADHAELADEATSIANDISHQQKRQERYTARRKYFTALSVEIEELEAICAAGEAPAADSDKDYPPLSLFRSWYEANPAINEKVLIAEPALKETEKSSFSKPSHIYESVSLLAREFWLLKNSNLLDDEGRKAARADFKSELDRLRLEIGVSITASTKKFSDKYSATVNGERLFMDQHLLRGDSYDSRYCLRIYFAWSERQNAVIIGHMPSHLRNEMG